MKDYKTKFDRLSIQNRWKRPKYSRNSDWVIVGIQEWWSGPFCYCYKLCIFGVDFQFWFVREFKNKKN